jgi:hypothetical protein
MVGKRFAGHAIPLEVLKDFAVLEEMIVELAKWHYLKDHPERQRTPRGFTDDISLKLTEIGEGSAIPKLMLFITCSTLLPGTNQLCYEKARDSIVNAIAAAEHNEAIVTHLPENFLGYFDRIGRSLREGECMEFNPTNIQRPSRLNKVTRRKLVLASTHVQELTEEIDLRGCVPAVDQVDKTFKIQVSGGQKVIAPLLSQHHPTIMEACNGFKNNVRVLVHGIGKYNRLERLQSMETIEHISILDELDVVSRLQELAELKDGWLDGLGKAPHAEGLKWLTKSFVEMFDPDLPLPRLYPTAEGGIQAEWSINSWEITLELNLFNMSAEYQALRISDNASEDLLFNLAEDEDWKKLNDKLKKTQRYFWAVERFGWSAISIRKWVNEFKFVMKDEHTNISSHRLG